jgi:hypothetical protein
MAYKLSLSVKGRNLTDKEREQIERGEVPNSVLEDLLQDKANPSLEEEGIEGSAEEEQVSRSRNEDALLVAEEITGRLEDCPFTDLTLSEQEFKVSAQLHGFGETAIEGEDENGGRRVQESRLEFTREMDQTLPIEGAKSPDEDKRVLTVSQKGDGLRVSCWTNARGIEVELEIKPWSVEIIRGESVEEVGETILQGDEAVKEALRHHEFGWREKPPENPGVYRTRILPALEEEIAVVFKSPEAKSYGLMYRVVNPDTGHLQEAKPVSLAREKREWAGPVCT